MPLRAGRSKSVGAEEERRYSPAPRRFSLGGRIRSSEEKLYQPCIARNRVGRGGFPAFANFASTGRKDSHATWAELAYLSEYIFTVRHLRT
jgi:hypothetical protein